ncbi:MAG: hypothetical protein KC635_19465 [Myxococcales bacterium]|nr:hypothetical protein [Myxococcales bacterium]
MRRQLAALGVALALALAHLPAGAARADIPPDEPMTTRIGVEGGPAIYLNSQSKTLPALIDPIFRARLLVAVAPLLDLGVEAVVNLPSDDNYRLIGGYLAGRAGLIRDDVLSFDLRFGFGAGTGPRILSPDLVAERDVTLWGQLGLELGAQLGGFGMHFAVVAEQFAVVSALIGVDFGL